MSVSNTSSTDRMRCRGATSGSSLGGDCAEHVDAGGPVGGAHGGQHAHEGTERDDLVDGSR
jgi:hypothetical protein